MVTLAAADLVAEGVSQAFAERVLPVVSALVERYASGAPEAVQNEAAIRCAGWLADHPMSARMSEEVGAISTSYAVGSLSALRHSGGMALLTPWKVRRGGRV